MCRGSTYSPGGGALCLDRPKKQFFLKKAGVPLIAPEAGLYALIDLHSYLPPPAGFEQEAWLWKRILEVRGLGFRVQG